MKRKTILFLSLGFLSLSGTILSGQDAAVESYIQRYQELAVREMHRTGIPASIKMAQAILESDAGRSDLAKNANNHFGIKCGSDWNGPTYGKKDDERGAVGFKKKSCFRKYNTPEQSFTAHSDFLTTRPNYAPLFDISPTNYKKWAKGLKKAGYATSNQYPKRLISVIERYDLDRLDKK